MQGAGLAGDASVGVSSGQSRGRRRQPEPSTACASARVMWAAPVSPTPRPCSLLGKGGAGSSQSWNGLPFADGSGFFPLSLLQPDWFVPRERGVFLISFPHASYPLFGTTFQKPD